MSKLIKFLFCFEVLSCIFPNFLSVQIDVLGITRDVDVVCVVVPYIETRHLNFPSVCWKPR